MTPQQIDAMKLALEALELLTDTEQTFGALDYGDNAITAIKEALTDHAMSEVQRLGQEIEQEPVAWAHYDTFKNLGSLTRARFTATLATKNTGACCIALYTHPINQKEFK